MKFLSTRDAFVRAESAYAIAKGLSDDGGLFAPEDFPLFSISDLSKMCFMDYPTLASKILKGFLSDFSSDELLDIAHKAYGSNFECSTIAPIAQICKGEGVLELFRGPTIAFKDMALQILPSLMSASIKKIGQQGKVLILVATSGDTGKAALDGFADAQGIDIAVFYPKEGVSGAQKLQMQTQAGKNVYVCAVEGNFDDAQSGVKRIFSSFQMEKALKEGGYTLSSANSINFGRLVPQIVYYFYAYCSAINNGALALGDKINFSVPTGNFGNILAAYYAKRMGLPINKLICASNKNNVLTDFFHSGAYNRKRDFYKTSSPSMDILISSNLERLLFELADRDSQAVKSLMNDLEKYGEYKISKSMAKKLGEDFAAYYCDEEQTSKTIKQIFDACGYLMDTHTAVAQHAYSSYVADTKDQTYTIIISTASPYKFSHDVLSALGEKCSEMDEFKAAERLCAISKMPIPQAISGLKGKKVRFNDICSPEKMEEAILKKYL